jgi:hypothetical protein
MHSALGARGTSPTAAHAGCSGLYATPAGWHGNRPPPALGRGPECRRKCKHATLSCQALCLSTLCGHRPSLPDVVAYIKRTRKLLLTLAVSLSLSCCSEYIPDIVSYIERIQANGHAYESNGSVYFDTQAFRCVQP